MFILNTKNQPMYYLYKRRKGQTRTFPIPAQKHMNRPHKTELEKELYSLGGRTMDDLIYDERGRLFVYMADGAGGSYRYFL